MKHTSSYEIYTRSLPKAKTLIEYEIIVCKYKFFKILYFIVKKIFKLIRFLFIFLFIFLYGIVNGDCVRVDLINSDGAGCKTWANGKYI